MKPFDYEAPQVRQAWLMAAKGRLGCARGMIKIRAIEIDMGGSTKWTMCVAIQAESEYLLVLGWPDFAKARKPDAGTWSAYQDKSRGVLCDWWHEAEDWRNDSALLRAWLLEPGNIAKVREVADKLIRAGYR